MNRAWKQKLNEIKFERRIKNACEEAAEQFKERVQESFEEIGKELQLISELHSSNFSLKCQDSFDTKKLFKIGGSILTLVGIALLFTPFGYMSLTVGIIGGVVTLVGGLFKSKDQKRREAVANISNFLNNQLKEENKTILEKTEIHLDKYCFNVSKNVNQYLDELIQGLEAISSELEKAQQSLDATVNDLNYGYAKRIIDWSIDQYETLTVESAKRTIAKVQRNFGHSIDIKTKTNIEMKKSFNEMKQILQEDISIDVIS